ncbi:hypothetical protein UlMin_000220 [Ulmus minor]
MALFSEITASVITLVIKPFTLFKLACLLCLRTAFIFIITWADLVKATISLYLNILWKMIMWTVSLITLPLRVVNAVRKEKQLELHLHEMQIELENLVWDRKELQQHLQTAIKEHKMMEIILAELEDDHDKAISKIELLQSELQVLKNENLLQREAQGKGYWRSRGKTGDSDEGFSDNYGMNYGIPSWKPGYDDESSIILQELLMQPDKWGDEGKAKTKLLKLLKPELKSSGQINPVISEFICRNLDTNEVRDERRGAAITQSLFSAVLSLLVGIIVFEAEDPCMPLVVALFTVVGMSLKSVVDFFSTIKNKPASDAVALLSFNWFILGTLTYPTLPRVARMLTPLASSLAERCFSLSFSQVIRST